MSDTGWLIVALATVLAGIGGYTFSIVARTKKIERSFAERRRKRNGSAPST